MSTAFPGFDGPSASTEAPLEMLAACHSRIRRQCATLGRLAAHLPGHGSDKQARDAATAIMRYFNTAAVHHHLDEEEDLYPALLESMAGSDAVCIRNLADGLTAEHRQMDALWRRLRHVLERIAAGEAVLLDAADVEAFTGAYARHMQVEEDEVLPMAARLLTDADIERIGRAMRKRRGISDDMI